MSSLILGVCGSIGSGKTTVANYLIDGYRFKRVRFADPLKNMLTALGLTQEEIDGNLKEKPCKLLGGATPRRAMQTLGTEWGRMCIDANLWIRAWSASLPKGRDIVVDDVRFPNEVKAVHDIGGMIIQIDRDGAGGLTTHASEMQGIKGDTVIKNNGTLDDLHARIDLCLKHLWMTGKVA